MPTDPLHIAAYLSVLGLIFLIAAVVALVVERISGRRAQARYDDWYARQPVPDHRRKPL